MASEMVSIVVPALNEAANLTPLVEQIHDAMAGRQYETIIVDDNSADDTYSVVAALKKKYPVSLIVRTDAKNGLSGAVLRGFAEARGETLVVMDADLQHPPSKLPELIDALDRDGAEFVVGSRYTQGGTIAEKWSTIRKLYSRFGKFLARPFAGETTDPLSGFFALKRTTFDRAQRLTPLGYKIGLELMCKTRVGKVREIPIHFAERTQGESKLTLAEQFRCLEHLSRLYDFTYPRTSPVVKFLIVLALSWFFAFILFIALREFQVDAAIATPLSYALALAITAIFHVRYLRTQREFIIRPNPWRDFILISFAELITCALAAWWTTRISNPSLADLFLIPFACSTVVRYVLRKEFLQDVRGLRKEPRPEEIA